MKSNLFQESGSIAGYLPHPPLRRTVEQKKKILGSLCWRTLGWKTGPRLSQHFPLAVLRNPLPVPPGKVFRSSKSCLQFFKILPAPTTGNPFSADSTNFRSPLIRNLLRSSNYLVACRMQPWKPVPHFISDISETHCEDLEKLAGGSAEIGCENLLNTLRGAPETPYGLL